MNDNDVKHLVFIFWGSSISSADAPHSWEVNRGEWNIKPQDSILQIDVCLIYKEILTLYRFILHEFPKILINGEMYVPISFFLANFFLIVRFPCINLMFLGLLRGSLPLKCYDFVGMLWKSRNKWYFQLIYSITAIMLCLIYLFYEWKKKN